MDGWIYVCMTKTKANRHLTIELREDQRETPAGNKKK